jgi:hypothetical protein
MDEKHQCCGRSKTVGALPLGHGILRARSPNCCCETALSNSHLNPLQLDNSFVFFERVTTDHGPQ